ncbi:Nuclear transport factor 2 family protein [Rhodovastum atsumiense]|uniref:Nuclear transport factor 2 family protein n=1 Tax=Rhodovastum atsumiense TaxID=504468 RepID=A0A5M6IUU2_9PROT|nr:nuclear transport factor 2 family protein [Rhodovastum atsumiense]KAA5612056.1 nuclear transport factor 2 family protein [Rhodovastum atsumiense]CAH2604076.1 Nuclear transport factor 2 family protein [Rhodovastum atsumiense]
MSSFESGRRVALGAIGAAALAVAAIATPARAAESDTVAAAVEALRSAMVSGNGPALAALVADDLTYGHSNGRLQDKADFLKELDGTNAFKSIDLSKQTVFVDGDVAVVRHVFDAVNNLPGGKTSTAHITVLQVWKKYGANWKLLARQSGPLPPV